MFQRFTKHAENIVSLARWEAVRRHEGTVTPEHLLLGILLEMDSAAYALLSRSGISRQVFSKEVEPPPKTERTTVTSDRLSPAVMRVIDRAVEEADLRQSNFVDSLHLLAGLLVDGSDAIVALLANHALDIESVRTALEFDNEGDRLKGQARPQDRDRQGFTERMR